MNPTPTGNRDPAALTTEGGDFDIPRPDVSHLITEDDTPVDNIASAKQQRLLVEPLYSSWQPEGGGVFLACANVGLFSALNRPPVVPDVFLSLEVEPAADWWAKEHRSYFLWEFGKPPEVVVEIVSNKEGGEADRKRREYARIGIAYYAIYDPAGHIQDEPLKVFALHAGRYIELGADAPLEGVGLTLARWHGVFERHEDDWLRWRDAAGRLIPTGAERADEAERRADEEKRRADEETERADFARRRADALETRLQALEGRAE